MSSEVVWFHGAGLGGTGGGVSAVLPVPERQAGVGTSAVSPLWSAHRAGAGWDPCTGLGVPDGEALLVALRSALGPAGG